MVPSFLSFLSGRGPLVAAALLALSGAPAQAQLWETPQTTARQPLLRGVSVQPGGKVLRLGSTTLTLDVVAGRVVGVLIEGRDTASVARALAAVWDSTAEGAASLQQAFARPAFQDRARLGSVQPSDENGTDLLAIRLTGRGAEQRWRVYAAVNVLPESDFPVTRNVTGQSKAPNVIHVLSDFQCPACRQLWAEQIPGWRAQPAKYRLFYHHFPLSYHANAFAAAEASECAAKQGQFWTYADRLFGGVEEWGRASAPQATRLFGTYAGKLKLDRTAFDRCLNTHQLKAKVQRQIQGAGKTYLRGTPTVYLNGVKLNSFSDEELASVQAVTRAQPSAASVIAARFKSFR
ncbi:DsbA family protein [Deinococcus radiodurans]|nr:DsbA family protein [Deinococcus radiodurans]QIP32983.1 DsbA family protein [Deinococcus radiodurans]